MNGIGHTYLAAATAATVVAATDSVTEPTSVALAAAVLAGAEIPDTDLWLPFVRHRGATHRAWLHALLVALTYVAVGTFLPNWALLSAAGLALGLVSHAAADAMTPDGLPYLAPFYRKPIRLMPFRWRVVPEGPPRRQKNGAVTRRYEPWHLPYRHEGRGGYVYVAVSQEWALAAITAAYGLVVYLTLPIHL